MKIAFTHNLRLTDVRHSEKEAEFDSVDTVNAIAAALEAAGHEVEKVEDLGDRHAALVARDPRRSCLTNALSHRFART